MDKQIITFTANEQTLTRNGGECHYSSNKVSYIEAHFNLGQNWSGYDSVSAVWFTDRVSGIRTVLDTEGICIVPTEVLRRKDKVCVNLVGSITANDVVTDRLTSYPIIAVIVDANARVDGSETAAITPSQFEQFAANVAADADRAEDAKDDARGFASDAQGYANDAQTSATNAHTSEVNAKASEDNAKASETNAHNSEVNAKASEDAAELSADRAEQAAADAGFMEFHIDDDGHLIYEHTSNVDDIDFELINGHLILEVA